jgi:hypothetical protein
VPSRAIFDACDRAVERIREIPPRLRDDPDIRAAIYADAMETLRQEAALDALAREMVPQTATAPLLLRAWEVIYRVAQAPAGFTEAQRQDTVLGAARRLIQDPTGVDWQDAVTLILGTTAWSYEEHDPSDPTTPAAYVIEIILPFDPAIYDYPRAEALIRAQSPAAWDFILTYVGGFELGESQLGEEAL